MTAVHVLTILENGHPLQRTLPVLVGRVALELLLNKAILFGKLASYENENPAMIHTLVLPGIIVAGITDGEFYRSSADAFNVVDFGRKCMSYSFWIRPAQLVASTWEQVIFSSSDEKFTVGFFYGRYDFWLPLQHRLFGDTRNLFIQDTWTHVVIQVGLDGMHYLHIDGVAIFSRSMFSAAVPICEHRRF